MNELEHDLRQQLLDAERELDTGTLRRLRMARASALERGRQSRLPRLMVPAMGMVTASIVALVLVVSPLNDQNGQDISPDNASFYQDLEFYYWLAESDAGRRS